VVECVVRVGEVCEVVVAVVVVIVVVVVVVVFLFFTGRSSYSNRSCYYYC